MTFLITFGGGELTFYVKARIAGDALEASIHGVRYVMEARSARHPVEVKFFV